MTHFLIEFERRICESAVQSRLTGAVSRSGLKAYVGLNQKLWENKLSAAY